LGLTFFITIVQPKAMIVINPNLITRKMIAILLFTSLIRYLNILPGRMKESNDETWYLAGHISYNSNND
jgi:hypothetical protein